MRVVRLLRSFCSQLLLVLPLLAVKVRACFLLFECSETAVDFIFLEPVMNAFVPCKIAANFLQIPHVRIVFVESIVKYLFAFFHLWNVDNFNDMAG